MNKYSNYLPHRTCVRVSVQLSHSECLGSSCACVSVQLAASVHSGRQQMTAQVFKSPAAHTGDLDEGPTQSLASAWPSLS